MNLLQMLENEEAALGRPLTMVSSWEHEDDVKVIVVDADPRPAFTDERMLHERRVVVWCRNPRSGNMSAIVSSEYR